MTEKVIFVTTSPTLPYAFLVMNFPSHWPPNCPLCPTTDLLSLYTNTIYFSAKEYPIFGLQWHPAKPLFEWKDSLNIDHSRASILASQYIANAFRNETTISCHTFSSPEQEQKALIYNYNVINSAIAGSSMEQIYVL